MPVVLPFKPSIGNYSFRSVLDGSEYQFVVHWNNRERAYYFAVRDSAGTLIASSIKVVLGVYFGRAYTHTLFRSGALVARIPQGNDRREPTFDDMGSRVQVWYFTRDEVVEEILGNLQRGGP